MSKQTSKIKGRRSYTPEFRKQAITLSNELESVALACEKLGIKSVQTLAAWISHDKKKTTDTSFSELLEAKEEIKRLKKDLEREKKVTAILRDATVFFCQENLK